MKALPLILEGLRAKHLHVVGLDKLIGGPTELLIVLIAAQPM